MASDLDRGLAALDRARPGYDKAKAYFDGSVGEVFSSERLHKYIAGPQGHFYLNYSRIPVVSRLARIEVAAVTVEGNDAQTTILQDKVWNSNDLLLAQKELHLNALMYGDAYLSVWPSETEEGAVDIDVHSPLGVRVIYSLENRRKAEFAIKIWPSHNGTYRANLYYPDRIERYIELDGDKTDKGQWVEFSEDDTPWVETNPFGRIPFFHFSANGMPYGTPVHRNAFGPQDSITKTNATLNASVEFMAFPQRYALSDLSGAESEALNGDFGFGDDVLTDVDDRASAARMVGGPARLLFLEGVKSVGSFEPGDAKNFLDTLTFHIKSMAQTTETPMHYFDPQGDAPSGESLRTAEAPFIKSVDDLKTGFTRPWSSALSFAMTLLGYDAKVNVRFNESQSTDDKAAWETIQAKIDAGVPRAAALLEAGYTAEQVEAWGVSTESTPKEESAPADSGFEE